MTKFLKEMTDFVFLEDEPQKAEVIFVPGSEEAILAKTAAKLYLEGYAPWIVPSGKYAKWTGHTMENAFETESDHFADVMMREGVPAEAILKEREATYTYENAVYTKALLDSRKIFPKRAILCCQAYHARRCKLYYQAVFPETEILVFPTETKGITRQNWFLKKDSIEVVLGEIEKCGSQFHEIVEFYGASEGTMPPVEQNG